MADTESIINGNEEKPKMYLYSGHEYNVALTLLTLKAFPPKVPNYGSYVVVEVHQINGTYGFMVSTKSPTFSKDSKPLKY